MRRGGWKGRGYARKKRGRIGAERVGKEGRRDWLRLKGEARESEKKRIFEEGRSRKKV